jgi:coenzyme F420 hydrogenase subunit beta
MQKNHRLGTYLPEVDKTKCNSCGLCFRVCPGASVDFFHFNSSIFKKQPHDGYLGNFTACHVGNSLDQSIRYNSSSGGIISSLLILALKKKMIDGAILTKLNNATLLPQVMIARTPSEIISASGSKYCPVPVNSAIKQILSEKGKFALVGLPCHIHGVRMFEEAFPALRKKIPLLLGLFCSHTVNFHGTEYVLDRMGIRKEDISVFFYRGGGWPGKPSAVLKNGQVVTDSRDKWNEMFGARFFTPMRCMLCIDATNELADISFGDPWLPRFKNERIGKSIVVCRTERGDELLKEAIAQKAIALESISDSEVRLSQGSLRYKKRIVNAMTRLCFPHKDVPRYDCFRLSPSALDYFISLLFLLNVELSSRRSMIGLLNKWSRFIKLARARTRKNPDLPLQHRPTEESA